MANVDLNRKEYIHVQGIVATSHSRRYRSREFFPIFRCNTPEKPLELFMMMITA
jgi:hypothetical protein